MIWRIVGLIGAGSFFVNGFSLLSDPSCVSADFGGGRVVQVTCRSDSFGTFSGTEAGLISLLIGLGLSTLIFFNKLRRLVSRPSLYQSTQPDWKNVSISNPEGLVDIKICDYCEKPVSIDLQKCPQCEGTYFNYKRVSPATINTPEKVIEFENSDIQMKKCPMCAEEIKLEAMKCRFCQHSFVATGVQKFNNSTSLFFSKAFSSQFVPVTVFLILVGLIGLGYGLNARSKSIERNLLLTSGEVCVTNLDGNINFGCADYPDYKFSYCSDAPWGELNFTNDYEMIGEYHKKGALNNLCNSSNPYNYRYEGYTDKLRGEYEISVWDFTKPERDSEDLSSGGTFIMKVRLKD